MSRSDSKTTNTDRPGLSDTVDLPTGDALSSLGCDGSAQSFEADGVESPGSTSATTVEGASESGASGGGPTPKIDRSFDIDSDAIDGYFLERKLSRGAQGIVFLATQQSTKRPVAIKFMTSDLLTSEKARVRFEREVRLVRELSHPGIVSIIDSGIVRDRPYYVMDLVNGRQLHQYVANRSPSTQDVLRLFRSLCGAVGYAHGRGVIHRDLKPANILVSDFGDPCVLDFGLAKATSFATVEPRITATGQVMGTLKYMSPEHASGKPKDIDARSDVYSLAVILYEIISCQMPYPMQKSFNASLATIQQHEPAPIHDRSDGMSADLSAIVHKGLSKDPSKRYANATELADEIGRYLAGKAIFARKRDLVYRVRKWVGSS